MSTAVGLIVLFYIFDPLSDSLALTVGNERWGSITQANSMPSLKEDGGVSE